MFGFERFGTKNGLPHNTISAIAQDRQGFLWLASDDGLVRYDGYEFEVFRLPAERAQSNRFYALELDRSDRLWVAAQAGLFVFDRRAADFERIELGVDGDVLGLLEDRSGGLWVSTRRDLYYRQGTEARFAKTAALGGRRQGAMDPGWYAARFQEDTNGNVWVRLSSPAAPPLLAQLSRGNVVRSFELTSSPADSPGLFIDAADSLWTDLETDDVLEQDIPLALPNLVDSKGERDPFGPETRFEVGAQDEQGRVWLGTNRGVLRHDPGSGETISAKPFPEGSWQHNYVRALRFDREGVLWVGTLGGLYRHDPRPSPFLHIGDRTAELGLAAGSVSSLLDGPNGTTWIGTFGGGLSVRDRAAKKVVTYRHAKGDSSSLCDDNVWALAQGSDRVWIGSDAGVCSIDGQTTFRQYMGPTSPRGSVRNLLEHPPGRLWVTEDSTGVLSLDLDNSVWRHVAAGDGYSYSGVATVGENVWLGTSAGALVEVRTLSQTVELHRPESPETTRPHTSAILDLEAAGDQALWVATVAGLRRYEIEEGRLSPLIAPGKLPASVVFSALQESPERLWLGTNQGLVRLDLGGQKGPNARTYGPADGTGNIEFNRHAKLRAANGELWFGGLDGITAFRSEQVAATPSAAPVELTSITVLGSDGQRRIEPFGLAELVLGARDLSVAFEFSALSFDPERRDRYRFRLHGLEDSWIDAGRGRIARYARLPKGSFEFQVEAANLDGVWGEDGVRIGLRVLPPFWETVWFRLLVLLLLAALLLIAHRVRVARLLALERMRLRIASDLHDELGSELMSISIGSGLLERTESLSEAARGQLAEIGATSRLVMEGLRDIVWTINPEHDSLESLTRRMRSLAASLLQGLDYQFTDRSGDADLRMGMAQRRELYLIFKEALHNAVRHANASRIEILLERRRGELVLEVRDDGRGIEPGTGEVLGGRDSLGFSSLRARAARLGGSVEVAGEPGSGTTVRCTIPLR